MIEFYFPITILEFRNINNAYRKMVMSHDLLPLMHSLFVWYIKARAH